MIRFPKKHIADSVADRIVQATMQMEQANPVQQQGAALDMALQQPVGDMAPIEGIEEMIPLKALDL